MFALVKEMNVAFGNPEGNPASIDMQALVMQAKSIGSEFVELMKALGYEVQMAIVPDQLNNPVVMDDVRDALCDIMVFDLGAFHRMGIDAERDMAEVVGAVMTRFCKSEDELLATRAKYDALGVRYTVHGEFPKVFLRSAEDQQMPEYPIGKFLKSAGYRQPSFYALPQAPAAPADAPSGLQRAYIGMAAQRSATMARETAWLEWQKNAVTAFQAELDNMSDAQRDAVLFGEFEVLHTLRKKG